MVRMYSRDYAIKVDFKVSPKQFPLDTKAVFVNNDIGCKITVYLVNGDLPIDLTNTFVTINIKESNENVYSLPCEILDRENGKPRYLFGATQGGQAQTSTTFVFEIISYRYSD